MRALRVSHSAAVDDWRGRERALRALGVDVTLLSARRSHEGAGVVALTPRDGERVTGVATVGKHPALFLYDPRPIWRALGERWDVIDIHEEPFALATAEVLLLRRLRGNRAPVVLYTAQNLRKRYPIPFRWFERWALRSASGISACNSEAADIVAAKGFAGRARVIPLGIDPLLFHPARYASGARARATGGRGSSGASSRRRVLRSFSRHSSTTAVCALASPARGPSASTLLERAAELRVADRVRTGRSGPARGGRGLLPVGRRYRGPLAVDGHAGPSSSAASPSRPWRAVFRSSRATPALCPMSSRARGSSSPRPTRRRSPIALAAAAGPRQEELRDAGLLRAQRSARGMPSPATTSICTVQCGTRRLSCRDPTRRDHRRRLRLPRPAARGPRTGARAACHRRGQLVPARDRRPVRRARRALHRRRRQPRLRRRREPRARRSAAPRRRRAAAEPGCADRRPTRSQPLQARLLAEPDLASVAPVQVDESGHPARVEWPFPTPANAWREAIGLGRRQRGSRFVIGSVLLLRAEALAQVGGFDERFFLYAEETDWAYRAHLLGWRHRRRDGRARCARRRWHELRRPAPRSAFPRVAGALLPQALRRRSAGRRPGPRCGRVPWRALSFCPASAARGATTRGALSIGTRAGRVAPSPGIGGAADAHRADRSVHRARAAAYPGVAWNLDRELRALGATVESFTFDIAREGAIRSTIRRRRSGAASRGCGGSSGSGSRAPDERGATSPPVPTRSRSATAKCSRATSSSTTGACSGRCGRPAAPCGASFSTRSSR